MQSKPKLKEQVQEKSANEDLEATVLFLCLFVRQCFQFMLLLDMGFLTSCDSAGERADGPKDTGAVF